MTSNITNAVCALLAAFAMVYALYYLFPVFAYALLVLAAMYGYAWLRRKI